MILSQDRYQLRKLFIDSWDKFVNNKPLTALEEQIASMNKYKNRILKF